MRSGKGHFTTILLQSLHFDRIWNPHYTFWLHDLTFQLQIIDLGPFCRTRSFLSLFNFHSIHMHFLRLTSSCKKIYYFIHPDFASFFMLVIRGQFSRLSEFFDNWIANSGNSIMILPSWTLHCIERLGTSMRGSEIGYVWERRPDEVETLLLNMEAHHDQSNRNKGGAGNAACSFTESYGSWIRGWGKMNVLVVEPYREPYEKEIDPDLGTAFRR